ncbi:MAG: thiolase domain-containing protein [Sulfolobaceae archaeon]|nr:thiolase domain-containing protein [Sulfolobaceae archaeon]
MQRVAIVGIGWYGFRPQTKEVSFREMMFEAAVRAYQDAGGINPREEVDTFISCQEDFWEGISIADEFAPDPIGGAMRPTMTVDGDGLQCLTHAIMHINSGLSDVTVVEAHGKPSDILTLPDIVDFAMDPLYVRKVSPNYHFIAGLDATLFMKEFSATQEDLATVVVKNKENGLKNPRASYASKLSVSDVLEKPYVVYPLTELDIAPYVDGAINIVLASEEVARRYTDTPIWIEGASFATDSANLETATLGKALYLKIAADNAYKMAKIESPSKEIKGAFIDDRYSYKELQHLEALSLTKDPVKALREGQLYPDGDIPTNPLGGHLAEGVPLEASGLALLIDAIEYLRQGKESAIVASWRGVPTFTGAVTVLKR